MNHFDISISSVVKKQCSLIDLYGMAATRNVTNSQRWHIKVKKKRFSYHFFVYINSFWLGILGLQPCDHLAMLGVKTVEFVLEEVT